MSAWAYVEHRPGIVPDTAATLASKVVSVSVL
jgi:hypothetical protein